MNLAERTGKYAVRVIRLCSALPRNRTGEMIARQILKSGTSPGAHFREALRARSKSEYTAKLNGGLMELEETLYWLELIEESELMTARKLSSLRQETNELIAIFVSLIRKWRGK
jgi:four helix bundle protein